MKPACPRPGCGNLLAGDHQAICTGDFHLLASMCRGKRRIGQPLADALAAQRGLPAYRCPVDLQYHNGKPIKDRSASMSVASGAARALRADPRMGAQGMIALADAWAPGMSERERWSEGLDQRIAFVVA